MALTRRRSEEATINRSGSHCGVFATVACHPVGTATRTPDVATSRRDDAEAAAAMRQTAATTANESDFHSRHTSSTRREVRAKRRRNPRRRASNRRSRSAVGRHSRALVQTKVSASRTNGARGHPAVGAHKALSGPRSAAIRRSGAPARTGSRSVLQGCCTRVQGDPEETLRPCSDPTIRVVRGTPGYREGASSEVAISAVCGRNGSVKRDAPDKNRTCARGLGNRCSIH